jgi:hypothetical protein
MFILLLLLLSSKINTTLHPIHIAISELNYNEKSQSIEVMHKIFIDDLEKEIEKEFQSTAKDLSLKLNTKNQNPKSDQFLKDYIEKKFKISIDGKYLPIQYIGKEYETDAVWLYFEIATVNPPKEIKITNSILINFYEDQDNLVHVKVLNEKKSLRFNSKQPKGTFLF